MSVSGANRQTVVVTDSTAALVRDGSAVPDDVLVVPLTVTVSEVDYRDGVDITCVQLAARLASGERVVTAQPAPRSFAEAYALAAEHGARDVVSIHLSGELSGTVHAAALAARESAIPVRVVDSGTTGAALGEAVLRGREAIAEGATSLEVSRLVVAVANASSTMFMVESVEHLRRGGRWGRAASNVGSILGVRPILTLRDGKIELQQLVRSRQSALRRLVRSVSDLGETMADPNVFVHFFDDEDPARVLAEQIRTVTGHQARLVQAGAVLGAHVGPGMLGVVVVDGAAGRLR